jgi:hypothetical protein
MTRWAILRLATLMTILVVTGAASAADMPRNDTPSAPDAAYKATLHYLNSRALLLMVRSTFDVVEHEDIDAELIADAEGLTAAGPSAAEMELLDRDLLAEASYFIVSLKYLTLVQGAVWPADKPETVYANDALVHLDSLQEQLRADIASGADPLPVLEQVQDLLLLSEGLTETPADRDMFAGRDALVANVIKQYGPWART